MVKLDIDLDMPLLDHANEAQGLWLRRPSDRDVQLAFFRGGVHDCSNGIPKVCLFACGCVALGALRLAGILMLIQSDLIPSGSRLQFATLKATTKLIRQSGSSTVTRQFPQICQKPLGI